MPPFRKVRPLRCLGTECVAKRLHKTLVHLDSIWTPPPLVSPTSSPTTSPHTSPMGSRATAGILPPSLPSHSELRLDPDSIEVVRNWLLQMPIHLFEDVVRVVLNRVESTVHEDKDCKLILTLINIERTKPSDFFFGVHSLFRVLSDMPINRLPFSTRTWFCIWEFEQLTTCDFLQRVMTDSLPQLIDLTHINLAYVASDKLLYLLSRYCRKLEELCLDHSHQVTDRGIRFLTGRSLTGISSSSEGAIDLVPGYAGCKNLRYLSLQGCTAVYDQALWYLLVHNKKLQVLRYHQAYSVAEILCNEVRKLDSSNLPELSLHTFDHPFPYGLNLPDQDVQKVSRLCPNVRILNLVSSDETLPAFSKFSRLTKATIEMEDAFGMGLLKFLEATGPHLKEFTISCGSDADSTFLEGGGRAFQLFNVGLRLARHFCPNLAMLNISGCGLVTNDLLLHLERNADSFNNLTTSKLTKLKTLILLTYYDSDETPVQTCEEKLLLRTLKDCPDLECLSLEGNFSTFLSDSFIANVMASNYLAKLRIFDVQGTAVPLTIVTAKRFLCLPSIQELRVSCWRLSEQEYKNLDDTVRMSGWDLRLSRRSTAQHAH